MVELVEFIARSLVDHPEMVEVKQANKGRSIIVELKVCPEDMGRVIGKKGRIAKAIRTIVKASATKLNERVTVDIVE